MTTATEGILLSRIRYGDNHKIANIYTRKFGKLAFMVYGGKSGKNRNDRYLQPMYILDMQIYHKESRDLQKIKEINLNPPFRNIPSDFSKTAVCQFMAELVNRTLRENEPDELLFDFLKNIIQLLDESEQKVGNFSPMFIVKYSRFLGLQLSNNYSDAQNILDITAGRFITGHPTHPHFANPELSAVINDLAQSPFGDFENKALKRAERNAVIKTFINYFNYHLNKPGKLNSLSILSEVFAS